VRGYVYTARDAAKNVLYVGTTRDVSGRMAAHRRTSRWWPLHATIEVQEFETLEEAAAAENDGICRHDPRFDVRGGHRL
jgi:predicted GIY-YIG superfamily endonuclease